MSSVENENGLTSSAGDERPCQRCIKRGLQDACHDGVRKKAKYLHDAPNEALMPGVGVRGGPGNRYQYLTNLGQGPQLSPDTGYPVSSAGSVYVHHQQAPPPPAFSVYSASGPPGHMPPPLAEPLMNAQSFSNQQSPISPHFDPGPSHHPSPMQSMAGVLQQNPQGTPTPLQTPMQSSFSPGIFDPNDPMQYTFDPASFNFGNHYGALEFGMLGHLSSGAADTPPSDNTGHLSQANGAGYTTPGTISTGYSGSPVNTQSYIYPQDHTLGEWGGDAPPNARPGGGTQAYNPNGRNQDPTNVAVKQEAPLGYAIGASSSSFTSPSSGSSPQNMMPGFDESPTTLYNNTTASHPSMQDRSAQQRPAPSALSTPNHQAQAFPVRRRDPSTIYESVKQPYSYTSGFHGLTAFLQKRFSPQKKLRIAKALASIRPSFISCTKTLNRDDLIFMEKCFQRTLWEYEDFINACGTPTIVCRRTGEVAAVGKEFSILTGWKKDVLLGKEPNLNVNTGAPYIPSGVGTPSRASFNNPPMPEGINMDASDELRPQPVFLAELLDDESAIDFYEDFARLAFGDSRGSVTTQCKLLKYKTASDFAAEADSSSNPDLGGRLNKKRRMNLNDKIGIRDEGGVYQLGAKDGKVDCSYCWTVKRDVFDIPMLIVMNVSRPVLVLFPPASLQCREHFAMSPPIKKNSLLTDRIVFTLYVKTRMTICYMTHSVCTFWMFDFLDGCIARGEGLSLQAPTKGVLEGCGGRNGEHNVFGVNLGGMVYMHRVVRYTYL